MAQRPDREQAVRGRLPAVRRDRRPALAALALLLILLGALGSALVAFRSGDRTSVLVAARSIPIGATVSASDFRTISVGGDEQGVIPATNRSSFIGSRAAVSVPEGSILNPKMFTVEKQVPTGAQLVGVVVDLNQRTSEIPTAGDVVRLYYVSGSTQSQGGGGGSTGGNAPGQEVVSAARVVSLGSGRGDDTRNVTVLVRDGVAGQVAELASSGHLAMTVLPSDTKPPVDLASVQ